MSIVTTRDRCSRPDRVCFSSAAHQHGAFRNSSGPCTSRPRAPRGARRAFCARMALAALVRVRPGHRGVHGRRPRPIPAARSPHWGVALSRWGNPFAAGIRPPAHIQAGTRPRSAGQKIGAKNRARAGDYIAAAAAKLYADAEKIGQRTRVLAYREAMCGTWRRAIPDDPEASIFYALSLGAARRSDRQDLREPAQGRRDPRAAVPGAAGSSGHRALHHSRLRRAAARRRARSTRRGATRRSRRRRRTRCTCRRTRSRASAHWQESIDTNIASAEAARSANARRRRAARDGLQVYAYLQTAQDARRAAAARRAAGHRGALRRRTPSAAPRRRRRRLRAGGHSGALGARAGRLDRGRGARRCSRAAFPMPTRMTQFARALGAARTRRAARRPAPAIADARRQLRRQLAKASEAYWAEQVAIQQRGAAWTRVRRGPDGEALTTMRERPTARTRPRRARHAGPTRAGPRAARRDAARRQRPAER